MTGGGRGRTREVVGHEETVESVLPLALEDEVVPLGNDVSDGASRVTLQTDDVSMDSSRRGEEGRRDAPGRRGLHSPCIAQPGPCSRPR
jgi:hypothetical protein